MTQRRILYISDSLGTPIPHRGIFNFSVALIERLKKSGASVTLLVERPEGNGIRKVWLDSPLELERAMDPWQNNEIYRYLNSGSFAFSLDLNEHLDFAARDAAHYRVIKYLEQQHVEHPETILRNIDSDFYLVPGNPVETEAKRLRKQVRIDFIAEHFNGKSRPYYSGATEIDSDLITETTQYLQLFDGFLSVSCVYSDALTRAHNFIPPYQVDCRLFDEIILDGPHYLSLVNNDPDRTWVTILDLIPLSNISLGEESHRSFSQKLFASLALDGNIIFISETAQRQFHNCFPNRTLRSERIIYPPARTSLGQLDTETPEAKRYLADLPRVRQTQRQNTVTQSSGAMRRLSKFNPLSWLKPRRPKGIWNSGLPFFVTVLSDEPYKNAALCIKAFSKLEDRANLLVVGRMDPQKYVGDTMPRNIHFTGFISDTLKNELIANSAGLIFPSFYEGFGIPVLEGALQGVPILCSAIDVFREIVGESGLYFDPHNADEMVACLMETLSNPTTAKARASTAQAYVRTKFMQEIAF
jgi:glycosyltransferase involved in cell wall biosynthesis